MGNMREKSRKFIYRTNVSWTEEKKGLLCSSGKPTIEVSTPPEFKGHEGMWTPEELFVASVNICIKTTFLHYAQKSNFEFSSYESEAEGVLERVENQFMFSEIKVRPKIVVSSSNQIGKAKELIELAEKNCLISNSIVSKVTVYPEIKAGP
ncbi:MAG: OsmC family protein [Candidatus Auribacterota bacterium]|nr:OsmC family protein [Candidatus Auribacterota bacterium]